MNPAQANLIMFLGSDAGSALPFPLVEGASPLNKNMNMNKNINTTTTTTSTSQKQKEMDIETRDKNSNSKTHANTNAKDGFLSVAQLAQKSELEEIDVRRTMALWVNQGVVRQRQRIKLTFLCLYISVCIYLRVYRSAY